MWCVCWPEFVMMSVINLRDFCSVDFLLFLSVVELTWFCSLDFLNGAPVTEVHLKETPAEPQAQEGGCACWMLLRHLHFFFFFPNLFRTRSECWNTKVWSPQLLRWLCGFLKLRRWWYVFVMCVWVGVEKESLVFNNVHIVDLTRSTFFLLPPPYRLVIWKGTITKWIYGEVYRFGCKCKLQSGELWSAWQYHGRTVFSIA